MKKLLYIHGFRSSAKSSTILNLKANYHEVEVHAFDVTHHPAESIKKIEDYVREHGIEILAGSSLGGYYTLCARVDIPKIAVNPAISPENSLSFLPEIGTEVEYYNENLEKVTEKFDKFACRMVQHEMSHLDGDLFVDHVAPIRKKIISKKLIGISRGKVFARYTTKIK